MYGSVLTIIIIFMSHFFPSIHPLAALSSGGYCVLKKGMSLGLEVAGKETGRGTDKSEARVIIDQCHHQTPHPHRNQGAHAMRKGGPIWKEREKESTCMEVRRCMSRGDINHVSRTTQVRGEKGVHKSGRGGSILNQRRRRAPALLFHP